ncbi:MAG: transposase [Deltaproteobacteria bacterium]|jgi:hypothetical protein|nr:transposase [Deltaproteobacteria bacterium]
MEIDKDTNLNDGICQAQSLDSSTSLSTDETKKQASSPSLHSSLGHIRIQNNIYASHYKDTKRDKNGKVTHNSRLYLGKVIDLEYGIFENKEKGIFKYTIEHGFAEAPPEFQSHYNKNIAQNRDYCVEFGDIWVYNKILEQSGMISVIDKIYPEDVDTVKALIAFRTLQSNVPYLNASLWYNASYAKFLYKHAHLQSQRISEFLTLFGQEYIYRRMIILYLEYIISNYSSRDVLTFPLLIDSTGLENKIQIDVAAFNNHNGIIKREIRLIYVVDQNTGLPIYFRYIPGNIIDKITLNTTLQELKAFNINIEFIIMDAGYYSDENIKDLISIKVPFVVRMLPNRTIYKDILNNHSDDLLTPDNAISYKNRTLFGKKIPIKIFNNDFYAFLMHDNERYFHELNNSILKADENIDSKNLIQNKLKNAGKFILLASKNCNPSDILDIYYARQKIEQFFDTAKNMTNLMPLRLHSIEAIRGHLNINFLATIMYMIINFRLLKSKYSANFIFYHLARLYAKIYPSGTIIVQEPTKTQNNTIKNLNLESLFLIESGHNNKNSCFSLTKNNNRKRGRPKKSLSSRKDIQNSSPNSPEETSTEVPVIRRKRGRPPGSKNKRPRSPL